jgi:hypothetical protein
LQLLSDMRNFPERFLEVTKNDWSLWWFGSVAVHTITIRNKARIDYKDVVIQASYYSSSDTHLSDNAETIYEIIPAGTTKTFRDITFWFVHSQVSKSTISVVRATTQ